jgi:acetylornithine deacetylase/succinyl-diaminopimelate desuccinylase-like protein
LNETTREYFRRYAAISSPEEAFIFTHLEDAVFGPMVQEKLRLSNFTQHSMLHTSISPTIINGGFRSNVIPGDARATLDIRALPDEDMSEFIATLRRIIDDPAVEVIPPKSGRPHSDPSRLNSDLFQALERAGKKVFPQAATIPIMLNGATDGAYLRAKGVQALGIGSLNESRAHGNDERASIELLGKFVEYMYEAVVAVAGSTN